MLHFRTMAPTLLYLPAEVRLRIYNLVHADTLVTVCLDLNPKPRGQRLFLYDTDDEWLIPSGLEIKQQLVSQSHVIFVLRTCKQIHAEIIPVIYSNITLILRSEFAKPDTDINNDIMLLETIIKFPSIQDLILKTGAIVLPMGLKRAWWRIHQVHPIDFRNVCFYRKGSISDEKVLSAVRRIRLKKRNASSVDGLAEPSAD